MTGRIFNIIVDAMYVLCVVGLLATWLLCVECSPSKPLAFFKRIISCQDREELLRTCSTPARTLNRDDYISEMGRIGLPSNGIECSVDLYKCMAPPWNFYIVIDKFGRVERIIYYAD